MGRAHYIARVAGKGVAWGTKGTPIYRRASLMGRRHTVKICTTAMQYYRSNVPL